MRLEQSVAGMRFVAVGGGTGMYTLLTGLRRYTSELTAVVTMSDNGGSSGRLRDEFGTLPPGDVRRCLVALSSDRRARLLRSLFEYRFQGGSGLNGHSFGNLLITALADMLGSPERGIEEAGRLLRIRGRVLPVTLTDTTLCARLAGGLEICGETDIDIRKVHHDIPIENVYLRPPATANPLVLEALSQADVIILGPGDLYTSVIPNLLVDGVADAVRATHGKRIYICNVMTKHGETDGFTASDFLRTVIHYLGADDALDCVILNSCDSMPPGIYERYRREQAEPVEPDVEACARLVGQVIVGPLATAGNLFRHDSNRLATTLIELACNSNDQESMAAERRAAAERVHRPA